METPTNVREAMVLSGVSQYQLAAHLRISQASVSRRLTGAVDFGVTELRSTADLLDVPVETLINAPLSALAEGDQS